MSVCLDTPSSFTSQLNNSESNSKLFMESSSSPLLLQSSSPSSEKEDYWSTLRNRVDTLLENRQSMNQSSELLPLNKVVSSTRDEDCLLLLRGFDSISSSLFQLKGNLHKAIEGARDLSKPSLTEILQRNDAESVEEEEGKKMLKKRRHDEYEEQSNENQGGDGELNANLKNGKLKKAKNLAISMAANAATLARELKSIRSDLSFMQERCDMLEEENMRLRNGSHHKGVEEDDLVRLQLEALLAEKSRLATENANLVRENQCLHQLVEYHQLTCSAEDIDQTYEQVVRGMCLDFDSPSDDDEDSNCSEIDAPLTPRSDTVGFSACLDQCFEEDEVQEEHK